jgi:hypothetical protein
MDHTCKLPQTHRIGRSDDTEKLYKAEDALAKSLKDATAEMARLLEHPPEEYWRLSMATAMLAHLNNTQREASLAAAVAFLRENGVTVPVMQGNPVDVGRGHQRVVTVFEDKIAVLFIE